MFSIKCCIVIESTLVFKFLIIVAFQEMSENPITKFLLYTYKKQLKKRVYIKYN